MAFLFKNRKPQDKPASGFKEKDGGNGIPIQAPPSGFQGANGRQPEMPAAAGAVRQTQSPTPANNNNNGVNNSMSSLGRGAGASPSPELLGARRAPSSEQVSDLPVSKSE